VTSLELLDALSTGTNTVTSLADALGISHEQAARQLSAATTNGLVVWADDDGQFTDVDADRRYAHASTAGLELLRRLQERQPGR
jgi:DNA-binding IclR family transcriptional regulator